MQSTARVIGPLGAVSIVAGSMLGIGIFLTPRVVAGYVDTPAAFLLAWLVGGIIALSGAVAYAELGTMFPRAGGDYVFLREAFGRSLAFASGWLLFAGVFAGSIATMAVPVWQYQMPVLLEPRIGPWDSTAPCLGPLTGAQLGALGLVALLTVVNHLGTRVATIVQTLLTLIPFGLLACGAVVAVVTGPHASAVLEVEPSGVGVVEGVLRANLAIYFAYAGWNAIGYVGGEVHAPNRTIPLGLLGGTALIMLLYGLLCVAFLAVLGLGGVRGAFEVGTATALALGGPRAATFVTLLIALALVGSLNGTILTGARIATAMARDGAIARIVGGMSPRFGTPAAALWVQALLASLLVVTGTFELLLDLTGIAMLAMGTMTVIALFVLRRRAPDMPRPYRATGYPVVPLVYLVASVAVIATRVLDVVSTPPEESAWTAWYPLWGLVVLACAWLGHAAYMRLRPQARQTLPENEPDAST